MNNISTIYRFNTPFLDLSIEKENLISLIKKIKKSIEFDWIGYEQIRTKELNYNKILLNFDDNLWKIELFYISKVEKNQYYLPIFKLNIFLSIQFLVDNRQRERAVKFLNNIFECFDWVNEKEFLIDLNNDFYYTKWLFRNKKYPNHDFSDLDKIKNDFESKNWMKLLEDFIRNFQNTEYILTKENSNEYHKLHWLLLYFIYLVFLIYQNLQKVNKAHNNINTSEWVWIYEWQLDLMKERLWYIDELNQATFIKYKNRLELFFKMF